jgi:hypothetical protein
MFGLTAKVFFTPKPSVSKVTSNPANWGVLVGGWSPRTSTLSWNLKVSHPTIFILFSKLFLQPLKYKWNYQTMSAQISKTEIYKKVGIFSHSLRYCSICISVFIKEQKQKLPVTKSGWKKVEKVSKQYLHFCLNWLT